LVAQVDILETMTPLSFAAFRTRLEHASGFQSRQFREVECLFGAPLPNKLEMLAPHDQERLRNRAEQTSIFSALISMLKQSGLAITDDMIRKAQHSGTSNSDLHPVLIDIYRENTALAGVAEQLVDLDEGLQEWRYRHIKMVERTIGTKPGTGGSDGASYLKQTLFKPCFADLWAIRIHF
jgi:tryptophan 2,3-dioxygenase